MSFMMRPQKSNRDDARVVERGERARLPLETSQALRVLRHVPPTPSGERIS
jgi:hypothetical protein